MILYYTGTGNSRYAAKLLGHRLNDTVRDCTPFIQGGTTPRFHSVTPWVFVCPTYAWQIPHIFADFLTRCHFSGSRQAYFVMTCGGEIHNAPETNRKLCTRLGLDYMGTAEIVMPENYIALFSTPQLGGRSEPHSCRCGACAGADRCCHRKRLSGNGTETHGVWQVYDLYRQPDFLRHLRP